MIMAKADTEHIFTPGPVRIPQYILEIGTIQPPYFRTDEFSALVLECERLLLGLAAAPSGSRVVFLTASGTGAMEASVANLLSSGDRAIVVNGGGFGQRFADLCRQYGVTTSEYIPDGDNLGDTICLNAYSPADALLVNAHETTTGVLYNLTALGKFCRAHGLLYIVDAISMFMTDELDMFAQAIDALIISSHKGLALPPGMSMVILSPRAQGRLRTCGVPLYFNFADYLRDGDRGQTPYTPAVTVMFQLQARLRKVAAVGIATEIARAERMATYFRAAAAELPLAFFSRFMPNAMTALTPTDGRMAWSIVDALRERYRIHVAPNGGNLRNSVFRVAHMGDQDVEQIDILINALNDFYGKRV